MKQSFVTRALMQASAVVALSLCAGVGNAATCFIVYDRNDQTIYRNFESPVDLSKPIGAQVAARWRGGAMVMVGEPERCIPFEIETVARATSADGATQASPSEPVKKSAPSKEKRSAK